MKTRNAICVHNDLCHCKHPKKNRSLFGIGARMCEPEICGLQEIPKRPNVTPKGKN